MLHDPSTALIHCIISIILIGHVIAPFTLIIAS